MRLTSVPEISSRAVRAAPVASGDAVATPAAGAPVRQNLAEGVVTARNVFESQPLVDSERVAEIRKAIAEDRYPIIPTKIADAMIAARLFGMIAK